MYNIMLCYVCNVICNVMLCYVCNVMYNVMLCYVCNAMYNVMFNISYFQYEHCVLITSFLQMMDYAV